MSWSAATAEARVHAALAECSTVAIRAYNGSLDLRALKVNEGVLVDGVHCYVDVANASELLVSDKNETERSHRRYLRFLHIYQRVADRILTEFGSVKIDFQNQRLHFIVLEPLEDAAQRVRIAVAVARTLRMAVRKGNQLHHELDNAQICVGIESGMALAVQNGTRGDREPLFLGNPANLAAKLGARDSESIHIGATAAQLLGLGLPGQPYSLTVQEMNSIAHQSGKWVDADSLLEAWREELQRFAQADIQFASLQPPLAKLELDTLTLASSRRGGCAALFVDVDGFTKYVANAVQTRVGLDQAVRVMHAIRKEMRDSLNDFGGRKIRYIGDCMHGLLLQGDGHEQPRATVASALDAAEAVRYGFGIILDQESLKHALGLQIGIEWGLTSVTGLGIRGRRDRVTAGRAIFDAERVQRECSGEETKLGPEAASVAADSSPLHIPPAPHRRAPPWNMQGAGLVPLRAYAGKSKKPYCAGTPCSKSTSLEFEMDVHLSENDEIFWQIVNTGYDAIAKKSLRGSFERPRRPGLNGRMQHENAEYRGVHSIQGFVVRGQTCVAHTPVFNVNVV